MNSNQRYNQAAIKKYRKELTSMLGDIIDIDVKIMNRAVNEGVIDVKNNTTVITGYMRRGWKSAPAVKTKAGGVVKSIVNIMDYSSYVNYGHRIVNSKGETVGFVKGQFMLERAVRKVDKALIREFKKEVERVNRNHDK